MAFSEFGKCHALGSIKVIEFEAYLKGRVARQYESRHILIKRLEDAPEASGEMDYGERKDQPGFKLGSLPYAESPRDSASSTPWATFNLRVDHVLPDARLHVGSHLSGPTRC